MEIYPSSYCTFRTAFIDLSRSSRRLGLRLGSPPLSSFLAVRLAPVGATEDANDTRHLVLIEPREDDPALRSTINIYGAIGFGLASVFAVTQEWSLPEFCWSTWLAGLFYAWGCIAAASIQIILNARSDRAAYEKHLAFLRRCSNGLFLLGVTVVSLSVGLLAFRLYSFLFGFYGLFLSVFEEMAPISLFGRNGFINSDFFTPVAVLVDRFCPMALGALVANWEDFVGKNPWRRILVPFQQEILRMHLMILALPFFSLISWALFRDAYPSATIVLLMGLFYILPKKARAAGAEINERSGPAAGGG